MDGVSADRQRDQMQLQEALRDPLPNATRPPTMQMGTQECERFWLPHVRMQEWTKKTQQKNMHAAENVLSWLQMSSWICVVVNPF